MQKAFIVYPNQLYKLQNQSREYSLFILVEDPLFFTQYKFHKHKLILHRASMLAYQKYLEKNNKQTVYIDSKDLNQTSKLFRHQAFQEVSEIGAFEFDDYYLDLRFKQGLRKTKLKFTQYRSPNFMSSLEQAEKNLDDKLFLTSFYINQRKDFDLLLEQGQKPVGGKWTYDSENRKKLPRGFQALKKLQVKNSQILDAAKEYVQHNFSDNPGETKDYNYYYDFQGAEKVWQNFLEHKLSCYGDYQDAISQEDSQIYHSVISPYLNIGLLSPDKLINDLLQEKAPLNAVEGFLRQVLGWREFIRIIYHLQGNTIRKSNYFAHEQQLNDAFYQGTTGIQPVDDCIKKTLNNAYLHHIERLMIVGNFMLLTGLHPDQVYCWFMELFIDAYDWVMLANVYSMSQYADGGLITTKPYISGANYILKMSDYKKGQWSDTFTSLYWNFIIKHQKSLQDNARMSFPYMSLKKFSGDKRQNVISESENYLSSLFQSQD